MPATHIRVSVRWRGFIVTEPLPRISFRHADGSIATQFDYTKHYSRSHDAVICVYDAAGHVIETHEHKRDFKEWLTLAFAALLFNTSPNDSEQHAGNDSSPSQEGPVKIELTSHHQLCRAGRVFPL